MNGVNGLWAGPKLAGNHKLGQQGAKQESPLPVFHYRTCPTGSLVSGARKNKRVNRPVRVFCFIVFSSFHSSGDNAYMLFP